jgi:hypothetical protein
MACPFYLKNSFKAGNIIYDYGIISPEDFRDIKFWGVAPYMHS